MNLKEFTIDPILYIDDDEVTDYLRQWGEDQKMAKRKPSVYYMMDVFSDGLYDVCIDKIGRGDQKEAFLELLNKFRRYRTNPDKLNVPRAKAVNMHQLVEAYGFSPRMNKICCPFHEDPNGSMHIYSGDRGWYCFGCNAGGDSIAFVQKYTNKDFKQAVKFLMTF